MKKALPAAIALAGTMGFAAAANAVNVNHDGLGDVLLYSYYTVNDGNDTLFNITNTTKDVLAVKVRFVEAMNSQEVLDFNLYLSPRDVWTGAVTESGDGAKIITRDSSCTVPAIPQNPDDATKDGVAFRTLQYTGTDYKSGDGGPQGVDRTRTGYLEVISMGIVNDLGTTFTPATWATHVSGVPANCAGLVKAWSQGGAWTNSENLGVSDARGGLYGSSIIVNVEGGTDISTDAVALDNFRFDGSVAIHRKPGTTAPSLTDADDEIVLDNGDIWYTTQTDATKAGRDAVSAVLAKENIMNDYLTVASLNASTDWVVTFPTKRFYVYPWVDADKDGVPDAGSPNPAPFTNYWTAAPVGGVPGSACEAVAFTYYDQEEAGETPEGPDFSPSPEGAPFALCYEANVMGISGGSVLGDGYTRSNLDLIHDAGWINIDFARRDSTGAYLTSVRTIAVEDVGGTGNGYVVGLPTIGFSAQQFVNGAVGDLLSNYAGSSEHKANQKVID